MKEVQFTSFQNRGRVKVNGQDEFKYYIRKQQNQGLQITEVTQQKYLSSK